MTEITPAPHPLAQRFTDLLSARLGGRALACSDAWFAPAANLVSPGDAISRPGHFVETGQWMDGWESRRSFARGSRGDGDCDWCVLRLGAPGRVRGFDIDTSHFRGNAPEFALVEGTCIAGEPHGNTCWQPLLHKSPLRADAHNFFEIDSEQVCTHLRLKIFPDGGVARLRAYGEARVNLQEFIEGELLDLAAARHGGRGVTCSDRFYSDPGNLLLPERGINMGDGWETRRRRDDGNDWAVIRLGLPGSIRKIVLDTAHFKGNFPDRFSLLAANVAGDDMAAEDIPWATVIDETPLYADREHIFVGEILVAAETQFTHVKLNIFPDGGVSRLRVLGFPDWRAADDRLFELPRQD
ncbi:allantoicase [Microbulbifer bruguierae]|uniref:Probable allantoicase n=1 Tax=Microbulbifer bruguierae TaxID=3029061 RepID=A0ABY8NAR0_9GAMM|nr:allantoicase [Microbulbifer bruguierae]WGL15172.1 allantoicase [Microbulbifer bruguierae]